MVYGRSDSAEKGYRQQHATDRLDGFRALSLVVCATTVVMFHANKTARTAVEDIILIAARHKAHAEAIAKEIVGPVSAVDIAGVGLASVIIAATPYQEQVGALRAAGNLAGKTVIEISNPVTPDFQDPSIGHTTSAARRRVCAPYTTSPTRMSGVP